jgi:hypothetical protein
MTGNGRLVGDPPARLRCRPKVSATFRLGDDSPDLRHADVRDENLPLSSAAILTSAGHDVDTVTDEGLTGAPDQDVVAAATQVGSNHRPLACKANTGRNLVLAFGVSSYS